MTTVNLSRLREPTEAKQMEALASLTIEPIEPDQVEDALISLDGAARWLTEKGIEQWPVSFTESPERCRKLTEEAESGNVFVAYWRSRPIGTVTVTDWQDPDFAAGWLPVADEKWAQYVMRLAIAPFARRVIPGLGAILIDYAGWLAVCRGASVLRLDCSRANTDLHAYYRKQGFNPVGSVVKPWRKSGALFERAIR